MLLPELNTPIGFAGKDGFYWWIGQVETDKDPKASFRYKVRIVGQHLKSCTAVPYEDLPWATVLMPVTHTSSEGKSNHSPVRLQKGDWVMGFFLDGATGQHPVIMGQMAKVFNSSKNKSIETSAPADACLSFQRYVPPTNPAITLPAGAQDAAANQTSGTGTTQLPASTFAAGTNGEKTVGNPAGSYFCVGVADPLCKKTDTVKTKMEQTLTEFFGSVSKNGGQIGTQMLSSATGTVVDYAGAAQGYISRINGIARIYVEAAKAKLHSLLKQGVKAVVKFLMAIPSPESAKDPKTGTVIKKRRLGVLGKLTKWLNEQLGKLNCQIADLEEKLLDFLTGLLTQLLLDAVNAATCMIEGIISKILSQISSFLESIVSSILGPLQALLGIIASPLNILGAALQFIFQLLGISCSGAGEKCLTEEQLKSACNKRAKKKPGADDFSKLDKLIDSIASEGVSQLQTTCEEAYSLPCPEPTTAVPGGGIPSTPTGPVIPPEPEPPSPFPTVPTYTPPTTPTPTTPTPAAVFPPVNITEDQFDTMVMSGVSTVFTNVNSRVSVNLIREADVRLSGSSSSTFVPVSTATPLPLLFTLVANKTRVTQSESITFTLAVSSGSVPDGTEYDYLMFGSIQSSDFVTNTTIGKMRISGNIAVTTITIADKISIADEEEVTFNVLGPGVNVDFVIYNNSPVTPTTPEQREFIPPVLGDPIVDNKGRILDIPIKDPGDNYIKPPFIRIYGEGNGASASAVVDEKGKIVKIKVERPGSGYVPNKPSGTNCYIDGFVIIRPGYGYTSAPSIYVNGEKTVAQAVVSNGYVSEIKIINKIKTFDEFPTIEIIGGGGNGALAIPSFSCLEQELFEKYTQGIAPFGTAEVVDCPDGNCDDCTV
jgi:hypothetical protein